MNPPVRGMGSGPWNDPCSNPTDTSEWNGPPPGATQLVWGSRGFQFRGGGWEKGSMDRTLVSYDDLWHEGAEKFLSIESGQFFWSTKCMANDDYSEPPRRADSKKTVFSFFFAKFWIRVASGARGPGDL